MSSPSPSNCSPALDSKWVVKFPDGKYLVSLDPRKPTSSHNKAHAMRLQYETVINCFEHWDREPVEPENDKDQMAASPQPTTRDK